MAAVRSRRTAEVIRAPALEAAVKASGCRSRFRVSAPLLPGFEDSEGGDELREMLDFTLHCFDVWDALGLARPLLVGHSRKRFLKQLLGREVDERSSGTLGVSLALAARGVDLLRVHEVAPLRDALVAWHAVTTGEIAPEA